MFSEQLQTHCEFEQMAARGWTLVARIKGDSNEFSPVSSNWAGTNTINSDTAAEITARSNMKNPGWSELKENAIRLCYDGPNTHCVTFTHNRGLTLSELFNNQFGVLVDEKHTFDSLKKAFGKDCDVSRMVRQWCGLNVASTCHPQDINPNLNPTNHIARIGCLGDIVKTCGLDDFALGVGVTSCFDGYGCSLVGPATPSLHYACLPKYGAFNQTAFLYIH